MGKYLFTVVYELNYHDTPCRVPVLCHGAGFLSFPVWSGLFVLSLCSKAFGVMTVRADGTIHDHGKTKTRSGTRKRK